MTDPEARLAAALRAVDSGHAAGRERLLAAMQVCPVPQPRRRFDMVRRHWRGGALSAAVAAALLVGLVAAWPPGALATTAAAIREAGSFRARISLVDFPNGVDAAGQKVEVISWAAEGMRSVCDDMGGNGNPQMTIERVGQPGVMIMGQNNTFVRLDPERRANPFFRLIGGLADARGRGAKPLGKRQVGDVRATGYEVALSRLNPRWDDDDRMQVWYDPATNRPVRLLVYGGNMPPGQAVRIDGFEWGLPTAGWFDTTPPAGYTEYVGKRMTDDEETELIVVGLRLYAQKAGQYPQVKNVYGDTTARKLAELLGRPNTGGHSVPSDRPFDPADPDELFGAATLGFTCINGIQRDNTDPAYYGRTVGPADAGKVLLRWKLAGGDYRVIFGDLRTATEPAARLKELER